MVEIGIVAAVVGVVMSVAVLGVSTAVDKSKRATELKAVYAKLEQVRAKHLNQSATAESCLRITKIGASTFELQEQQICGQVATPELVDFRATILTNSESCVDNLARPVDCADGEVTLDVVFDVEIDGRPGADGIIVWRENGRLTANFAVDDNPGADVQAHLADASHHLTPEPTAIGRYAGEPTNPRGLLE